MFKTFKQAIETWLRNIVAEVVAAEVSSINTSLAAERTAMCNFFASIAADVDGAVERLSELSHHKENAALREHIKDLEAHVVTVLDTLKALHPTYKV